MANLTLDKSNYKAFSNREKLDLEPKEFEILWLLAEKPGRVFHGKDLYVELKKVYPQLEESPFRRYIHQLRYKLGRRFVQVLDEDRFRLQF